MFIRKLHRKHEHHSTVIKLENTCIIIKLTRTNDKRFKLLKYIKYKNKLFKKKGQKNWVGINLFLLSPSRPILKSSVSVQYKLK